jgi:hypothetical protein
MEYAIEKMIEVDDWDKVVKETYGRPYNFQQQDGCKSRGIVRLTVPEKIYWEHDKDTVPEIVNHEERGVRFKAWLERDPNKKIPKKDERFSNDFTEMWWERNFYPEFQHVANDLHEKGLLEAGEYYINIDW